MSRVKPVRRKRIPLSAKRARETFTYDKATGVLRWKHDRIGGRGKGHVMRKAGDRAGTLNKDGYRDVRLDGELHKEHRVIWAIVTGKAPRHEIDHVNGRRADNRFENLREATASQNKLNATMRSDNTSGYKWVRRHQSGKFQATVQITLGVRSTPKAAHELARRAARVLHREFFNDGRARGPGASL